MFATVWSDFLAAPTTLGPTPGVRDAWRKGRARYAVWVLRVDVPAVRARMAALADPLAPHGLLPFQDPHVTVFVAGFPTERPVHDDDVADAVLDAQVAALTAARPRPPRLTVGGLNAFLTCAILEVHDLFCDLVAVREPLTTLHPELRYAPYRPHVTVGTFSDTRPTAPIAAAILPFRDLAPIPFEPDAVELVTFDARETGGPLATRRRIVFSE